MSDIAETIRKLEHIKTRFERGDELYGRDVVATLLAENQALAQRCLPPAGFGLYGDEVEEAKIWHRDCGWTHRVGDLEAATYWARSHACPPPYLGVSPVE